MAMARPPSVIVLIDMPNALNTSTVIRIEIGMAISEMKVVRTFSRNRKRMTATTATASSSTFSTLPMEVWMKLACLNRISSAWTPFGRNCAKSLNARSTSAVSSVVSAPGCFCTDRITAGLPLTPASPRFTRAAKSTAAIWWSRMGCPVL